MIFDAEVCRFSRLRRVRPRAVQGGGCFWRASGSDALRGGLDRAVVEFRLLTPEAHESCAVQGEGDASGGRRAPTPCSGLDRAVVEFRLLTPEAREATRRPERGE